MSSHDKVKNKAHVDHPPFRVNNGQGSRPLYEPVPALHVRTGDYTISAAGMSSPGTDNNTIILFGRDRSPYQSTREGKEEMPSEHREKELQVSGFSDHMAAGAIDIIVGRGAPYPMANWSDKGSSLPPAYCWQKTAKLPKGNKVLLHGADHPGWITDSSRIYISQMADIDKYFRIGGPTEKQDLNPSAAIVLKSDKIRLHARRDIKIIAGGDWEPGPKQDSNGFAIKEHGSIHLMSGNDKPLADRQQPIVLGDNLVDCLKEMTKLLQDLTEVFYTTLKSQMELNNKVANHIHATGAGPTTTSPLIQIENFFKIFSDVGSIMDIYFSKTNNIKRVNAQFLERRTEDMSGKTFILSAHHTVN